MDNFTFTIKILSINDLLAIVTDKEGRQLIYNDIEVVCDSIEKGTAYLKVSEKNKECAFKTELENEYILVRSDTMIKTMLDIDSKDLLEAYTHIFKTHVPVLLFRDKAKAASFIIQTSQYYEDINDTINSMNKINYKDIYMYFDDISSKCESISNSCEKAELIITSGMLPMLFDDNLINYDFTIRNICSDQINIIIDMLSKYCTCKIDSNKKLNINHFYDIRITPLGIYISASKNSEANIELSYSQFVSIVRNFEAEDFKELKEGKNIYILLDYIGCYLNYNYKNDKKPENNNTKNNNTIVTSNVLIPEEFTKIKKSIEGNKTVKARKCSNCVSRFVCSHKDLIGKYKEELKHMVEVSASFDGVPTDHCSFHIYDFIN